jgi:crotonobetainyl-CoA:carnitine CoA-transferase CaiB-like acyl-CoA transferase
MSGPLDGVRVVELAQLVAGPYCGTLLAGLGADVVKIEPAGGDMSRQFGPFPGGESAYFRSVNHGKRTRTLSFSDPDARAELTRQLDAADVLIHNMRPAAARRLGVTGAQLHESHPRLVVCEISAFGSEGVAADRVGVDLVAQAESGLMSVTGFPPGPPTRAGTNVPDFFAAVTATAGVLAALRERDRTGVAPTVSMSLLQATVAMQTCWIAAEAAGGEITQLGNGSPFSAPTGSFRAADRDVVVSVVNDEHWRRFCAILALDELPADPRFGTNDDRCAHRTELDPLVAARFATRPAADWVAALREAGLPVGLALDYTEVRGTYPHLFDTDDLGVAVAKPPFELVWYEA